VIGSPYYRMNVGEFENSDSPYGTFDQGGNIWEWNEAIFSVGSYRCLRVPQTPGRKLCRAGLRPDGRQMPACWSREKACRFPEP
jgi:formylglycine-generating enzyme required for sulfatase activity